MKKVNLVIFTILMLFSFKIEVKAINAIVDVDDSLNLRSDTNIYSNVVASVPAKIELVYVVSANKTGGGCSSNWYHASYKGNEGYVCGDYLELVDNVDYDIGKAACFENDDPLNVWSNVNKSSRLARISCDQEMYILEKSVSSNSSCANWYRVLYGDIVGYSCGTYIYEDEGNNSSGGNKEEDRENIYIGVSTTGDNIYEKNNYMSPISGDGFVSCYEDTGNLTLRSSPGGNSTGNTVSCGVNVKINEIRESSGSCGYYYNITNLETNKSGWVCGYFVNTTKLSSTALSYYEKEESLEEYYTTLRNKGFPDSYLGYLAEIHARHPNWKFEVEKINLDFDDVVANEAYYGRNLLQGSAFNYNYRSMGLDTYDILSDQFFDYPTENGWYNASTEAIAFYLDPRNYLNEKYIFAFESLYYNSSHNASMVSKILSNQTFWPVVYANFPSNVSDDLMLATEEVGISSVHIASRIKQEISGISTTDPRLGGTFNYNGVNYSGYFNFFNIKVYGTNKIVNGMKYAMENGWDSPYDGLYGGSQFVYNEYVGVNQDTMYYEKFDVSTNNGHYTHQYMQNLAATVQETNSSFNSYVGFGDYLDKEMTFTIPVYENMSDYAVVSPRVGNPNNYLKDLKVNGSTVSGFSYDVYEYDITLPALTDSINVNAVKINEEASVSGDGNIAITDDKMVLLIDVVAENGRKRTYTLNILRLESEEEEEIIPIEIIMNNSGVKYDDNYIFGISEDTNIGSFIENIKGVSEISSVSVKDKNGNAKSGVFMTGDMVLVSNSKDTKSYAVLIYGDINGDGKINKDDCLAILRQLNGYVNLDGVYREAADANKDKKIDKDDCLAILRQLNGYANLN